VLQQQIVCVAAIDCVEKRDICVHIYMYIDKQTEKHETYIYRDIHISCMYRHMSISVCLPRNGRHMYINMYIHVYI